MAWIKNLLRVVKKSNLNYFKRGLRRTRCLQSFFSSYPSAKLEKSNRLLKESLRLRSKDKFYRTLTQSSVQNERQNNQSDNKKLRTSYLLASVLSGIIGYYFLVNKKRKYAHAEPRPPPVLKVGEYRSDLPTYPMTEVRKHATAKNRIWTTYKEGVYDITDYVRIHPGSEQIMIAAGGPLEPSWILLQAHMYNDVVSEVLEKYRIGNLKKEDQIRLEDLKDPFTYQPKRHPELKPLCPKPFNGEVSGKILAQNFITPNEFHYVRSHLPVPECDAKNYKIEVEVEGRNKTLTLSLDEIKRLPKVTITCALMCSGNRRSEVPNFKSIINWGIAGIGNAKWTGARLCDVLAMVGITEDENKLKHVQFEGIDRDQTATPYGVSIPIWKAVNKRGDVLLAYEMNGVPLPPDHGYPLRVLIPGVAGARSCKWLERIIVSEEESQGHYQRLDYKGFNPSTNWDNVDFTKSPSIIDLPVTSAILNPLNGETVKVEDGHIKIKGYAYSGGGQKIVRVDVTTDGGDRWHVADLEPQDSALPPHHWAWTLWTARVPVEKDAKEVEIWCKGVDSAYNTQAESFKSVFNFRAVLNNPCHKIKVKLGERSTSSRSAGIAGGAGDSKDASDSQGQPGGKPPVSGRIGGKKTC